MRTVTIQELLADERNVPHLGPSDPINHSYQVFVRKLESVRAFTPDDVTVAAFMSYGWMPTILDNFKVANLSEVASILNRARAGEFPSRADLAVMKESINNSLVGSSKLLHFVNPGLCAIWDGRVYEYIEGHQKPWQVEKIGNYGAYHDNLRTLIADPRFEGIQASMSEKVGYPLGAFRAAEYVMYVNAPLRREAR